MVNYPNREGRVNEGRVNAEQLGCSTYLFYLGYGGRCWHNTALIGGLEVNGGIRLMHRRGGDDNEVDRTRRLGNRSRPECGFVQWQRCVE